MYTSRRTNLTTQLFEVMTRGSPPKYCPGGEIGRRNGLKIRR